MQAVGDVVWVGSEDAHGCRHGALRHRAGVLLLHGGDDDAGRDGQLGLEPEAARQLAISTLYGAGRLVRESDGDVVRLRAEVTSAKGTTEAAMRVLEAGRGARDHGARRRGSRRSAAASSPSQFGNATPQADQMNAFLSIVEMLLSLALGVISAAAAAAGARGFPQPGCAGDRSVTNPLILPLRRIFPPIGKVDTASVVAVLLIAAHRRGRGAFALLGSWAAARVTCGCARWRS